MTRVSFVCMPWAMLGSPSAANGILRAVARAGGLSARAHSFHVAFGEFLLGLPKNRGRLTLDEYEAVCSVLQNVGGGDWPFVVDPDASKDESFFALLRSHGAVARKLLPKLRRLCRSIPEFLDACADEVLAASPRVVGFTTVYSQTWPNAALAHVLTRRDPSLRIVFGGASCEGPMGRALLEAFPWVTAVARGEAENVLVPLVAALADGGDLGSIPNVCYRDDADRVIESQAQGEPVDMDSVPIPDYSEYFERLDECPRVRESVAVQLPITLSRGCWWGAKKHCTFCGLNGLEMAPRQMSPDVAHAALVELARRHRVHDFVTTDNILPLAYFDTLLPRLAQDDLDLALFYEVKANLSREQVALLRSSGVRAIQPGIESLSSPVLELMRKGATATQNVRLLKWSISSHRTSPRSCSIASVRTSSARRSSACGSAARCPTTVCSSISARSRCRTWLRPSSTRTRTTGLRTRSSEVCARRPTAGCETPSGTTGASCIAGDRTS